MSLLAYFDTNVFDHLHKKNGVTGEDERLLRAAVSSRRLIVVVSHTNIRETLAALRRSPDIVAPELNLIANLANWDYFVRFHSAILEDDIRHFAYNGERANTVFEDNRTVSRIQYMIRRVIDDPITTNELEAVIREDWEQKRVFLDGIRKARAETEEEVENFRKRNETPSFQRYFAEGAEGFAFAFAQSFGVAEECKRRGLTNLLKIPSMRSMVGAGMSLIYRTAVETKSPKSSTSRDLQHAVCAAAAADVFVTHDEELSLLLKRAKIKSLRVMTLHQLLQTDTES